ncbi:MAG: serine/threonine protein kinase [Myxococcota bacterium]|jgi:serine/threonine protein kinase
MGSSLTGRTYLARQISIDRLVVIKFMHEAEQARSTRPVARFEREGRALARLDHPGIAALYDYGVTADGRRFMVTEFVDGRSLKALEDRFGWLPQPRALALLDQLAAALGEAHRAGLVHRNLKPQNVFVSEERDGKDRATLVNFGLVKEIGEVEARDSLVPEHLDLGSCGTPRYMSPEQALGSDIDARSDVYSFGALAYELLTGSAPFEEKTPVAYAYKHASVQPEMPTERFGEMRVHPEVEALLVRCLRKRPSERFASMDGVRAQIAVASAAVAEGRNRHPAVAAQTPAGSVRTRSFASRLPRIDQLSDGQRLWLVAGVAFGAAVLGALVAG